MGIVGRTVLVVDDEPQIRALLREYLAAEGYQVLEADSGATALRQLGMLSEPAARNVDLVLLDIGLPDVDGLQVLTQLRRSSQVYVILVTARTEETDKLVGLTVGADDYITKPFSVREVVARIKAAFRRMDASTEPDDADVIVIGDLRIDLGAHEVRQAGALVELSALDFDLLAALAASPGRVLSRVQLLEKVWGYDFYGDERVVDVHRLRERRRTRWARTSHGAPHSSTRDLGEPRPVAPGRRRPTRGFTVQGGASLITTTKQFFCRPPVRHHGHWVG